MLFAFGVLVLVVVGLSVGGLLIGVTPLAVLLPAFLVILVGGIVAMRVQSRRLAVEREREQLEFTDDDYRTLAHRPEHTHGHAKRGPTRRPGATP
jgi:cell division protein FtsL